MKLVGQEYNPVTGITTQWLVHNDGKLTVRGVQDVEPVLLNNLNILNGKSSKSSKLNESEGLGTKVASIPYILVDKLKAETGINLLTCSNHELHKILNDPDYRKLRTAHGRI